MRQRQSGKAEAGAGAGLDLFGLVLLVDVQVLARRGHVRGVDVVRDELAAVARRGDGRRVLVEDVDLLERQSLGLWRGSLASVLVNVRKEWKRTSGMQKYAKTTQHAHVEPQMKKTLTWRPALPAPVLTR